MVPLALGQPSPSVTASEFNYIRNDPASTAGHILSFWVDMNSGVLIQAGPGGFSPPPGLSPGASQNLGHGAAWPWALSELTMSKSETVKGLGELGGQAPPSSRASSLSPASHCFLGQTARVGPETPQLLPSGEVLGSGLPHGLFLHRSLFS